ncbi:MAG: response regulator [Nitrospirae bacterium]|nr:response regulator [Nitrospirota bacterium]
MEKEIGSDYLARIKKTVYMLFVDDESIIIESSLKALKRRFKEVYTANNGEAGWDAFKKYKPDLVVTDLVMPITDGIELIKRIRDVDKVIPIIVMTALNEEEYLTKAKDFSIQGYLMKPVDEKAFWELLFNVAYSVCVNKCVPC